MPISSYGFSPSWNPHWSFDSVVVVEGVVPTVANIGRVRRALREANQKFVLKKAAELYWRTQGIVPYLSGTLYRSAFIKNVSTNVAYPLQAVGYDTGVAPYAVYVHEWTGVEHPTRGPRPEPKQDHFLSEPRDQMAKTFDTDLAKELEGTIHRMRSLSGAQKGGYVSGLRGRR